MKSKSLPWTKCFFNGGCPCGSGKKSYACCWRGNACWEKTPVGVTKLDGTPFKNDRCYLWPVGSCSTKMTKEHFISRNILEKVATSTLRFENAGHFFGGQQTVEIGIDSFSAKVLCDKHNSALSDLDTAAGAAFSTIEALAKDFVEFARLERGRLSRFHICSGVDIERWMIKVYCGLVAADKIRALSGRIIERDTLQPDLLNALVGTDSLRSPLGLYMHTFVGQQRRLGGFSFGTIKLTDGSDEVGGLILSLGVMNFVLVTSPRFNQTFKDPNWYRHQTLAWNFRKGSARLAYLFTY